MRVAAPPVPGADWGAADRLVRRAAAAAAPHCWGPLGATHAFPPGPEGDEAAASSGCVAVAPLDPAWLDSPGAAGPAWTVWAPAAAAAGVMEALAALPFALHVDLRARPRTHNLYSSAVMQSGTEPAGTVYDQGLRPLWQAGLLGRGQLVGVGDTGLDYRSCFFADEQEDAPGPRHRKVEAYREVADGLDSDGHGTHVCGSIAGNAAGGGIEDLGSRDPLLADGAPLQGGGAGLEGAKGWNGMAPEARLAFTDLGLPGEGGYLIAPPTMQSYYDFAYRLGARVHSDSWGGTEPTYTQEAREIDAYTFQYQDFLPVVAAVGLEGQGRPSWGGGTD